MGWLIVFGLGLLALLTPEKAKGAKPALPAPPSGPVALPPTADVPLTLPDMYTIVEIAARHEVNVEVLRDLEARLAALSEVDYSWQPYLAKVRARLGSL